MKLMGKETRTASTKCLFPVKDSTIMWGGSADKKLQHGKVIERTFGCGGKPLKARESFLAKLGERE